MDTDIILNRQREFFNTDSTLSYDFRIAQLKKLKTILHQEEQKIFAALHQDLKKSETEAWITELSFVHTELKLAIRKLKRWMRPKRTTTNLINLPSKSRIHAEPLGVVLIIGPWNYPFHLMMLPLISAMAAGNCVCLKSSEHAPATANLIENFLSENFDPQYISCVQGDGETRVRAMLEHFVFDHIFFTGSPAVGKKIYQQAAAHLVPVTLELGGKSPVVVEKDADITVAAKRIVLAKFLNAGQTCVAPDYVLVHEERKSALIEKLKETLESFYGAAPATHEDYGRMVHEKHFERVISYLKDGKIIWGGQYNRDDLYIEPSLMDEPDWDSDIMQEEIFGPILPILTYSTQREAIEYIRKNKNPLAFYVFTGSAAMAKEWIQAVPFGSGCINNVAVQLTNPRLPFGGRGRSGTGRYHGKFGFDNFSHQKSVVSSPTWFDPAIKYPPYKGRINLFKKLMG